MNEVHKAHDLTRRCGQRLLIGAALATVVALTGCRDAEEKIPAESMASQAASATPTVKWTNIPDDQLLEQLRAIPLPGGAEVKGEGAVFSGAAQRGFGALMSAEDVFSFYTTRLTSLDWMVEVSPTAMPSGVGGLAQASLTNGTYRLMILVDTSPKAASPGYTSATLIVEPVWYPGINTNGILGPSPLGTPVIIGG